MKALAMAGSAETLGFHGVKKVMWVVSFARRPRLLDQLIGVLRAAGGDDALLQAQRRRLLEDQRELLDRRGDDERVGIGGLDLGELGAHVLSRRIHGL